MYATNYPKKRYRKTINFFKRFVSKDENILDLGVKNPLSKILINEGYKITNTNGEDLDLNRSCIHSKEFSTVSAFQIFEHMLNPFQLLNEIESKKLICSIPLKLWFASAYKNSKDIRDNHYHEFEKWQFEMLLNKTGWHVVAREKFTNPVAKIGFRPILRLFTPRYLLIYAEKSFK